MSRRGTLGMLCLSMAVIAACSSSNTATATPRAPAAITPSPVRTPVARTTPQSVATPALTPSPVLPPQGVVVAARLAIVREGQRQDLQDLTAIEAAAPFKIVYLPPAAQMSLLELVLTLASSTPEEAATGATIRVELTYAATNKGLRIREIPAHPELAGTTEKVAVGDAEGQYQALQPNLNLLGFAACDIGFVLTGAYMTKQELVRHGESIVSTCLR